MKLVVGLGNPGRRYEGTRHNVGFMVVDVLAGSAEGARFRSKFDGLFAECFLCGERTALVKPETLMNRSGRCVRQALDFYKLPLSELLVICDDLNLPLGRLRIRSKGSDGGQKGLRDIQDHLGTDEYPRLRLGIDRPPDGDAVSYVLERFSRSERPVIEDAVARAAQAVAVWIARGIEACMNEFNALS